MKPIPQLDFSPGVDLAASIGGLAHRLFDDLTSADLPDPRHRALVERALAVATAAEERLAEQSRRIAFLEGLSRTDELTGLLNRRGFLDELRRAIARARRTGEAGVVIYGDIDRFKEINDLYGHACGDAVLREAARTVAGAVREIDTVARLGGDEFAILLAHTSARHGRKRARALQGLVDRITCDFGGHRVTARMSLGTEPYSADDEAEPLLSRADTDMYCNKRRRSGVALASAAE
jgi:diguanylate cyclase (GGDEF)-like protein